MWNEIERLHLVNFITLLPQYSTKIGWRHFPYRGPPDLHFILPVKGHDRIKGTKRVHIEKNDAPQGPENRLEIPKNLRFVGIVAERVERNHGIEQTKLFRVNRHGI